MAPRRLVLTPATIRRLRQQASLTQAQLAKLVGVSTAQVSSWERGKGNLSTHEKQAVRDALARHLPAETAAAPRATRTSATEGPSTRRSKPTTLGVWLNEARVRDGRTIGELARDSNTSPMTIEMIESGRTQFPRETTIGRLAEALGSAPPSELRRKRDELESATGIGAFEDFDPYAVDDIPISAGVYIFYDRSDRPIYVGQTRNLRRRVLQHEPKFWFKKPIVESASFIPIKDTKLRQRVEEALIFFLRSNAVVNDLGTNH
jgi:transcriptional regulator with XRE-family HTH domain